MAYARPGVYITERLLPPVLQGGVTAEAAGAVVAPFAQGPEKVTLIQSWYEFTSYFGGYNAAYPATFEVGAYFNNGGKELYVKRLLPADADTAHVNLLTSASAVVATVTAKNAGTDGNKLYVKLAAGQVSGTYTLYLYKDTGVTDSFSVPSAPTNTQDDLLLERYENIVFNDSTSSSYAETVINTVSPNITISNSASGTIVTTNFYPLTGGDNGGTIDADSYNLYKDGEISVFEDFSTLDRPLVMFLPAVSTLEDSNTIYTTAMSWAESNKSFVIVQPPKDTTVDDAIAYGSSVGASSFAANYYPWVYIADPVGRSSSALRLIGPSGAIAGLYIKTDGLRGVFKAPAGIGVSVSAVVAVEKSFTSANLDDMNSASSPVNPIRQIPGAGLSVMGARTLLQDGTANKYVNMRRSLSYIQKQLHNLTQFAIFENNDEQLWGQIRTSLNLFLNEYKNKGGLRGETASQAYFVKCDAENNNATTIANGEIHIQVGVALQYPAEFIVIDLSQKTLV
jgi:hypothetical protein